MSTPTEELCWAMRPSNAFCRSILIHWPREYWFIVRENSKTTDTAWVRAGSAYAENLSKVFSCAGADKHTPCRGTFTVAWERRAPIWPWMTLSRSRHVQAAASVHTAVRSDTSCFALSPLSLLRYIADPATRFAIAALWLIPLKPGGLWA